MPSRVVVQDDQVTIGNVEAREVVHRVLGVVNVIVDHVSCPSCLLGGAPVEPRRRTTFVRVTFLTDAEGLIVA